jgi:glutaredoxin 3
MHQVTIYSTPHCPYCLLAKKYFAKHNVEYTEINVEGDEAALNEMERKSGQVSVPVLEIDGHVMPGFNKGKVDELLELKKAV